ncbi:IclR family transcriptional regulator [Sesbania bispinosa]|nr:IclR family transcriptional regulator [Sesbania bispinosa]
MGGATAAKPRDGELRSMTETMRNGGFAAEIRTAMAALGAHNRDRRRMGMACATTTTARCCGDGGAR